MPTERMLTERRLPAEFSERLRELEALYLRHDDPIRQSGFGGGAERWRAEREPILRGIDGDGDVLDVGCANGYLVQCLCAWGREQGLELVPWGVDHGEQLIAIARARMPERADHFFAADAWDWVPARRFRWVYALRDCVPRDLLAEFVWRLLDRCVEPGGRLVLGAYGSRSRKRAPFAIARFLQAEGFRVVGTATGGEPPLTAFAWIDR